MFGLISFAIASVMIGCATSLSELYLWRAIQAFSGGSSVVVFPLIQSLYGNKRSGQVISYVMACVVIAPMVAPMIGSQILTLSGWEWIFYALAIFSLVTLAAQMKWLPARKVTQPQQALNIKALLSGYKNVLLNGTTMAYVLAGGSSFAGMFAFVAGSPFVYIEYFGVPPTQFGYLVALNAIALVSVNLINARLLKDIDPTRKLIVGGVLLAFVGLYLITVAYLHLSLTFVVAGVVAYVGLLGLTAANAISAALATAGKNAGLLSGINGVLQFGLGALSSAVVSISASIDATTMNITMAVCAFSTLIFVFILKQKTRPNDLENSHEFN